MGRVSILILAMAISATLSACAHRSDAPTEPNNSVLIFDQQALKAQPRLLFLVPGALNPLEIFGPQEMFEARGYAVVGLPMPGLDGASLDPPIDIRGTAADIVALARTAPDKPVHLIGFSAGGSIALEAASTLDPGRDVRVAVISGLPGFPGALGAGWRAATDVLGIMLSTGSFSLAAAWDAFYPVLLFGRDARSTPELQEAAADIRARRSGGLVSPSFTMLRRQVGSISLWSGEVSGDLSHAAVLFLHGEDDPVIPLRSAQRFAATAPNGRFVIVPERGHMLLRTDPELLDTVFEFFDAPPAAQTSDRR